VNSLFGMLIRNNLCDLTISSYYTLVYSCAIRSWKTYQSSFLYLRSYCIGHPVNRRSCSWKHRFFFKVYLQPRCIDNRPGRFSVDINHATKKWCILLYVKNIYVHESSFDVSLDQEEVDCQVERHTYFQPSAFTAQIVLPRLWPPTL